MEGAGLGITDDFSHFLLFANKSAGVRQWSDEDTLNGNGQNIS